jgi:tetratricopeptide (TPR) repeat protein
VKHMKKLFLLIGFGIYLSGTAFSQSVAWTDPGQIPPQSGVQLDLVFTDCQPKGNINLPSVSGLQFSGSPGRATSFSMINFQTSSSTTLSYVVQASQNGRILIPSFEVVTDKGRMTVPSLTLDATASGGNRSRQSNPLSPNFPFPPTPFQNQAPNPGSQVVPPDAVQASAQAEPRRPYIGEVFDVNYRVVMTGNRSGRVKTTPLWDVQNFTAEAWDRGQQIGPGGNQGLQFHTRAMVPKAGLFELPSIRQKLDIDTAAGGRSFFFTAPGSVEVEAVAAPVPLNVEALPANAPAGFKGAVGQFALESKLVPEQVGEGEPVTWTLTLRGTGNWPMGVELPARAVPKEIRTIQPKLRREFNGTDLFTGAIVEDLVMIPTKSGEFELPAVKFLYFDPKKKSYEAAEVKPPKIVVSKQAGGLALPASPASPAASTAAPSKKAGQAPSGKVAQPLAYGEPGLPREPIEGSGFGIAPVGQAWWVGLGILPWGILLALWWRWARQRALFTDEERLRKESLQSWKSAVEMVREAGQDMRSSEKALLFWQKSVAGTLGIEGATPAWGVIADGIQPMEKSDQETLEKCWVDSENGLYGRNPSLDGEWCDQAERLAGRIDLPAIKVWAPLKPKNLFPWITALLFLFVAVEPLSAQGINKEQAKEEKTKKEDPIQLYKTGNFSEAENVWREKVVANPRDPVARNNLALAYFQLGDKERALAYGLSAYLISPETASVAWNTRIFAQSADQLDRAVMGLWSERSREWITGRLGVFGWQLAFVLGVTILAVGCGFGLGSGYFSQKRTLFVRVGIATFAIGLMLFMAASTALGIYGKLADRNAVMIVDVEPLRSIPTEAEAQAEKAYPPGSIARLEKSFLGWSKIRLPNQDAGWIRSEHIVSLY